MSERRGAWYLLTGLIIGLMIGLAYSLWFNPIQFSNIAPRSLGEGYKDHYHILIARAYEADGDIGRARARLALLREENIAFILAAQAQKLMAEGGNPEDARALAALEDALRNSPQPAAQVIMPATGTASPTGEEIAPEATSTLPVETATVNPERAILTATTLPSGQETVNPTMTPRATQLPESVVNAAFILNDKREVCIPGSEEVLLQIEVLDRDGEPLPGLRIQVTWDEGEDYFFTGLYPQVHMGYADFNMQPDVRYSVRVGDRGQLETDLSAVACTTSGGQAYSGGWWLTFQVP